MGARRHLGAALLLALLCPSMTVPGAPGTPEPLTTGAGQEAGAAEVWSGSLHAGLLELQRLSDGAEHAAAVELGGQLLRGQHTDVELAAVQYARGVAGERAFLARSEDLRSAPPPSNPDEQPELLDAKSLEPVRGPFRAALSLAGDGDLRLDSAYALATLQLLLGEEYRAQLLNALPAAPPQQPGGQAPPTQRQTLGVRYGISPGEDVQDPLPLAREAYLAAREEFALRLALDWRDPDARANTELCIRRLRELDEFERQREEQEQEQDSEQQQEDGGDSEDQEESDEEESEQEQEEQQPGEGEREQEEEQQPEETSEAGPETPPEERLLTREEVKRLLDRLSEIEERRDELNARIQGLRRQPAEKDW